MANVVSFAIIWGSDSLDNNDDETFIDYIGDAFTVYEQLRSVWSKHKWWGFDYPGESDGLNHFILVQVLMKSEQDAKLAYEDILLHPVFKQWCQKAQNCKCELMVKTGKGLPFMSF